MAKEKKPQKAAPKKTGAQDTTSATKSKSGKTAVNAASEVEAAAAQPAGETAPVKVKKTYEKKLSSVGRSKTRVVSAEAAAAEQAVGAQALLRLARPDLMVKFGRAEGDSGSPEVQIALLTQRIVQLTEHFKSHPKDSHSQRGMMRLINRRKKLLAYLREDNLELYRSTIGSLGLRK